MCLCDCCPFRPIAGHSSPNRHCHGLPSGKPEDLTLTSTRNLLDITVDVVTAYVTNNALSSSEVPDLVVKVHKALARLQQGYPVEEDMPPRPAVPVHKSIKPNYIICLEDGLRFKTMRRHLMAKYGLSPDQYRARWGLSQAYPMVAPSYATQRSNHAKQLGLGARGIRARNDKKTAKNGRVAKTPLMKPEIVGRP